MSKLIFDRQEFTTPSVNGSGVVRESRRDAMRRATEEYMPMETLTKIASWGFIALAFALGLLTISFVVYLCTIIWAEIF